MGKGRKRVVVSLEEKLKAVKRIEQGESAMAIARELNVGRSTIMEWRKNELNLMSYRSTVLDIKSLTSRRMMRKPHLEAVDTVLWLWYLQQRESGLFPSGPQIRDKALQLSQLLESAQTFTASSGWLARWKSRHGVSLGEQEVVDSQTTRELDSEVLHNALSSWFSNKQEQGEIPSDSAIQQKALQLNQLLAGMTAFSVNEEWLGKWKERYDAEQQVVEVKLEVEVDPEPIADIKVVNNDPGESVITHTEARDALEIVLRYIEQEPNLSLDDMATVKRLQSYAVYNLSARKT